MISTEDDALMQPRQNRDFVLFSFILFQKRNVRIASNEDLFITFKGAVRLPRCSNGECNLLNTAPKKAWHQNSSQSCPPLSFCCCWARFCFLVAFLLKGVDGGVGDGVGDAGAIAAII